MDPTTTFDRLIRAFPQFKHRPWRSIDEGWDHLIIIVDEQIVFRFPLDEEYTKLLGYEIRLLESVRPLLSVAVPHYTYIAPDARFAGYDLIAGQPLTPARYWALDTNARQAFAQQLADTLSVLHTLPQRGVDISYVPLEYIQNDQQETKAAAAEHLAKILSEEDYTRVQSIMREVDDMIARPLPTTFVHNDLYDRHLLWNDTSNQLGILDWSDMTLSDPAIDFGEIHEYGFAFVRDVYDRYQGPKDPGFLTRAWTYQCWTAVYMMTDHFSVGKTDFVTARETFDMIKRLATSD